MNLAPVEQRNPYLGATPRPWLRIRVLDANDVPYELTLIADTGCPYAVIIDPLLLFQLSRSAAQPTVSNFGPMTSAWVRLQMPAFGIDLDVLGYGSAAVAQGAAVDDVRFQGLVGLPVLAMAEYGGNATDFWFRYPPTTTTTSTL